jgi:hypothetical protein
MRAWRAPRQSGPGAMSHLMAGFALLGAEIWAVWGAFPQSSESESAPQIVGDGQEGRADVAVAGELHTTAEWFDFIFDGMRQRREERSERRPRPRSERPKRAASASYRTLCVRLCDGFYFPVSYSTSREHFAGDASQCERQCPARSRLFVYRNPGEEIEDMRDLDGQPYRSLPTALVYRTQYVADCTCRGNPWDEATRARHRGYAVDAASQSVVGKVGGKR